MAKWAVDWEEKFDTIVRNNEFGMSIIILLFLVSLS